jgi:hypothetical protein
VTIYCGVERTLCQKVLDTIVAMKFLCINANGTYARLTDRSRCVATAASDGAREGKKLERRKVMRESSSDRLAQE